MKKYIIISISLLTMISCQSVLDVQPTTSLSENIIYSDLNLTENLVDYTYNCTSNWGISVSEYWASRIGLENACDESQFHFRPQNYPMNNGTETPGNVTAANNVFVAIWAENYSYIASTNNFLSKIENSPVIKTNPTEVAILKAEMMYLRATCYSRLVNFFGGVVLVKNPFILTDNFTLPRSSYEDCVNFIVSDLDAANALMPASKTFRIGAEFGKVSKVAILALKSRVLLYAASPLHDGTLDPKGPLYDYTKATKWQDAADAAKAVIDVCDAANKKLVTTADFNAYQRLFLVPNDELLFARPYSPLYGNFAADFSTLPDKAWGPVSAGGWGLSNPTQNIVDDYKMANGLRINDTGSGYNSTGVNKYIGRELRFYANIYFQGSNTVALRQPNSVRPIIIDYSIPKQNDGSGFATNHFAKTGYNVRKFQDESVSNIATGATQSAKRPYPIARLAEIYLNYAEAMYHLPSGEAAAQTYASKTAQRAGLPAITTTGAALLADIKYEREMELFFEGHRYFDLRRWRDEAKLTEAIRGVTWSVAAGVLTETDYKVEDRLFTTAYYYLPIPLAECQKAGLEQNFGYTN